jgi:hypothetical protein
LEAQGAVTRIGVTPIIGDKFGITTRVKPAIHVAFTEFVNFLEAIETNSHPYRFSVGS